MDAGYLARSAEQERKANGDFGSYLYLVGLPADVKAELELASARFAHSQNAASQNEHRLKKRTESNKNGLDQIHPLPLPDAEAQQAADDGYTPFGRNAFLNGMKFVFENSYPFEAWRQVRGSDGMPPIDTVRIDGRRRRGCWFPSLYPRRSNDVR